MKSEPEENLVDRLIREAMESGEWNDLPGSGKPIPGAGTTDDEYWWLRDWVKRNQIDPNRPQDESSGLKQVTILSTMTVAVPAVSPFGLAVDE